MGLVTSLSDAGSIAAAARAILQDAVGGALPPIAVKLGFPNLGNDDACCYLFHHGSRDLEFAGPGVVRRTHEYGIHLLLRADQDTEAAELALLALHDPISDAFYADRRLRGMASTSALRQLDAQQASSVPFIKEHEGVYRQRWWMLEAVDQRVYDFRGQ